jgi:ankyrin repeat protein
MNLVNKYGNTPLHLACWRNMSKVALRILTIYPSNDYCSIANNKGKSVYYFVNENKMKEVAELIKENKRKSESIYF